MQKRKHRITSLSRFRKIFYCFLKIRNIKRRIDRKKMVKSAMNLLATNKQYKNGLLTGMLLARQIAKDKKIAKAANGGRKIKGGFNFKKALAIAAGPLGWAWLAHHNGKKAKEVQKKLEKYEPKKPKKNEKKKKTEIMIEDFPEDDFIDPGVADDENFSFDDFE